MIFRKSCVASYLLAMATTVSWVHCGGSGLVKTPTRHRKLSKAGDGGDGDGDKKKHCGAQHVSGTYTNCYACFMMFGFTPTTIVPGCTQMPGTIQLDNGQSENVSIKWEVTVSSEGIVSANNTDRVIANSSSYRFEDTYVGLLDFDSCALNLVATKVGGTITGQLYRNHHDGSATFDVVRTDHHKERGGVASFKCEKPPVVGTELGTNGSPEPFVLGTNLGIKPIPIYDLDATGAGALEQNALGQNVMSLTNSDP